MIKLIVAYDENMLIGNNNDLPWKIKEDLEHFKRTTLNQNILFGKTTYETIPFLNERNIFVLSKERELQYKDKVTIINDYESIVKKFSNNLSEDIYICGGVMIYELFLPYVDEMIISFIKGEYIGNKYFPKWNKELFKEYKKEEYKEFDVIYFKRR